MLLHAIAFAIGAGKATPTYAQDLAFLKRHAKVIELSLGGSRLAVVPAWQGRVMTSAIDPARPGYGFINYDFIKSGKLVPHMNVFGGEERYWLGPEGGQFSIFFKKGDPFDLGHWQTPPIMDTIPFRIVSRSQSSLTCRQEGSVSNMSGTKFNVEITRTVKILGKHDVERDLSVTVPAGVKYIGFETDTKLTNKGRKAWTEKSGLLSVWILGMMRHSPTTTVVIPFRTGDANKLGKIVNDDYFGKVPSERLVVGNHDIYFRADGKYRSKIGLTPKRALDRLGSWGDGVLTIVEYSKPGSTKYVNSKWEMQKQPFSGDCVNSYNDGPPAPGKKPLGPFYEVESSSPALALRAGKSATHIHRIFHFTGARTKLNGLAMKMLGVGLDDIEHVFGSGS